MVGLRTASRFIEQAALRCQIDARIRGLRVRWFDDWCPELSAVSAGLPLRGCAHDEYELLAARPGAGRRIALVERAGAPVAVIVLRRRGQSWTPVTAQCLPFAEFPCEEGWAIRSLAALGVPIVVPDSPVQADERGVDSVPFTPYHVDLTADYEALLRSTGYRSTMRNVRERTKHLELRVDAAGTINWTIEQWVAHWTGNVHDEISAAEDMATLWTSMAGRGTVITVSLHEEARCVAGFIVIRDDDRAFGMCTSRVADVPRLSLGTAIVDRTIDVARSLGCRTIDLGGYSSYKHRIASPCAQRYTLMVTPLPARVARRVRRIASRVAARVPLARRRGPAGGDDAHAAAGTSSR